MIRRYYQKPPEKATERRPASDTCPAYIAWLHSQPCCATGVRAGEMLTVPGTNGKPWKVRAVIEAAHLKSRGTFGPDLYNAVPLELSQHRLLHKEGRKSYPAKRGLDLQAIAEEHTKRFLKLHPQYAA